MLKLVAPGYGSQDSVTTDPTLVTLNPETSCGNVGTWAVLADVCGDLTGAAPETTDSTV